VPKDLKTATELEAMIIAGLRAQNVDAASITVYGLDDPGLGMNWTVRTLRLNKASEIKAEGVLKRVLFALLGRYDLSPEMAHTDPSLSATEPEERA
jgi:hypothetical protein